MDKEDPEHCDIEKAIAYLEKASDSAEKNVYAAYRLGCIYMDKEDPEHYDAEKAIAYLEKASENPEGNIYACLLYTSPAPEEQGKRSGTGDDVPPNPFVYRVLDAARPGKSIRGLQHPQLGEVLVDLEKLITQNAGCFAPQETNVRVIVR